MIWKWPCFHRYKWGEEFTVLGTTRQRLAWPTWGGEQFGRSEEYQERRQQGTCEKCGLIKERMVSLP